MCLGQQRLKHRLLALVNSGTSAKLEETSDADGNSETTVAKKTRLGKLLAPLQSLASLKAAVPFALNQSGSTLFYYLLSSEGKKGNWVQLLLLYCSFAHGGLIY